jgi:hypothetical protein
LALERTCQSLNDAGAKPVVWWFIHIKKSSFNEQHYFFDAQVGRSSALSAGT